MNQPITNWQRTFIVRSTIEKNSLNLAEALATKDVDEIIASLNRFGKSIETLKQMYDFESSCTQRTSCDTDSPWTKEDRNEVGQII